MKLVAVLLVLSVILLVDHGAEAQRCNQNCPNNWNPVCGSTTRRGRRINCTFRNQCIMERYACNRRERWGALLGVCDVPTSPRECPRV